MGDTQILGKEVDVNGRPGIVVADKGNAFSRDLDEIGKKTSGNTELGEKFDELDNLSHEDRLKKINGGISERVSLRKDVEDEIWLKAKKDYYSEELEQFIDPNTFDPIPNLEPIEYFPKGHPCEGLKKPRADIGHKPGKEWHKRLEMHKKKGSSRKKIIEMENNADLYHIEDRSSNRGRQHEIK